MSYQPKPLPLMLMSLALLGALWWGHQRSWTGLPVLIRAAEADGALETFTATVRRSVQNREGIWILETDGKAGRRTVMAMPNLGKLSFSPGVGDVIEVTARAASGDQERLYYPVSARHLTLAGQDSSIAGQRVTIREAARLSKGTPVQMVVAATRLQLRKASSGKTHLHFTLQDETGQSAGVMWQGTFNERIQELLRSGQPVLVRGEVDQFRNDLSLIVTSAEVVR